MIPDSTRIDTAEKSFERVGYGCEAEDWGADQLCFVPVRRMAHPDR
jgi:hypothetical protein